MKSEDRGSLPLGGSSSVLSGSVRARLDRWPAASTQPHAWRIRRCSPGGHSPMPLLFTARPSSIAYCADAPCPADEHLLVTLLTTWVLATGRKIGRASCRERG